MNRFSVLIVLGSLSMLSLPARAQVDIDHPVNFTRTDHVFSSSNDPKVLYMMPVALKRTSAVRLSSDDDRTVAHFEVGIPDSEFSRLQSFVTAGSSQTIYAVRALEAFFVQESGTDIERRFRPIVSVAGDPRNITGPIRYALSVRRRDGVSKLLKSLFGPSQADHIGNLRVQFDAIALGKPYPARSVIPIFVGETNVTPLKAPGPSFYDETVALPMILVRDSEKSCWEAPEPGTICLLGP